MWGQQLLVLTDVRGEPTAPFFKEITIDREGALSDG